MNFKFVKKGILIAVVLGAVLIPSQQAGASDEVKVPSISEVQDQIKGIGANVENQKYAKVSKVTQATENRVRSFIKTDEEYILVFAAAQEDSDWVGKVYDSCLVNIVEDSGDWAQIESGNVKGFVKTACLVQGVEAVDVAKQILAEVAPEKDFLFLNEAEVDEIFAVGETKEEEAERLAAEEAERLAEEQARLEAERAAQEAANIQKGQDIVAYAKQFIGNPYVYGGTSLTNGADCSGFVKSVYAHFGVSLPRTSYAMRSVGRAVSYDEMRIGDIVCYAGHVAIYAGNGKIVNAIDEEHGIGLSRLNYRPIVTIRRIF